MGDTAREGETVTLIEEEITPSHLRCGMGTCPGVYRLDNGNLLIIGKRLSTGLGSQINHRVGEDEHAIELSPEFFRDLTKAS